MDRLQGKVAVITGGTSGIGLAIARRFTREGAAVVITGRRQEALDEAVAEIGGDIHGFKGDVSSVEDLGELVRFVRSLFDHVDVLCANAGGGEFSRLEDITEAHYEGIFGRNVKGVIFTVQTMLPLLADGSSVILTGSTAGSRGTPAFSVYSASKAAVRNFARTWAMELAKQGIRVNVLSPGATSTAGLHGLAGSPEEDQAMQRQFEQAIPLGRLGRPDEIAAAALFLASDESSYMNGSEMFADGGLAQV